MRNEPLVDPDALANSFQHITRTYPRAGELYLVTTAHGTEVRRALHNFTLNTRRVLSAVQPL